MSAENEWRTDYNNPIISRGDEIIAVGMSMRHARELVETLNGLSNPHGPAFEITKNRADKALEENGKLIRLRENLIASNVQLQEQLNGAQAQLEAARLDAELHKKAADKAQEELEKAYTERSRVNRTAARLYQMLVMMTQAWNEDIESVSTALAEGKKTSSTLSAFSTLIRDEQVEAILDDPVGYFQKVRDEMRPDG